MIGATRQIEITVHSTNQPASLGRLLAITASCGADVLAASSHWDGANTVMKLVTEDARRTLNALQAAGFNCQANPIVLVEMPDKPGMAALLGNKLVCSGVDVLYSYLFHSERQLTYAVFKTSDDERAIYILEVESLIHELAAARSWHRPDYADVPEPQAA